jgi:hypothetical protein
MCRLIVTPLGAATQHQNLTGVHNMKTHPVTMLRDLLTILAMAVAEGGLVAAVIYCVVKFI